MVTFLVKKFVKDYQNTKDSHVRSAVGRLCGYIGILANVFLFVIKYLIGAIVNSVSIRADAINNLSDACSNIISIVSFHLSNKPADKEHPFGHERTETIASLFVGLIVGYIGIEMARESVNKILHPEAVDFRMVTVLILVISILVKLWMYFYNKKLSKIYDSSLLEATALDSISDVMGTGAVLLSTVLSPLVHWNLDGYMGIIVSCLILYNAYGLIKEVINSLLGEAPDTKIVQELNRTILSDRQVLGVHDLMIHNYGPNRLFANAHVEVDSDQDIFVVHDAIDNIERKVKKEMGIELVLHMDPVKVNDPLTEQYKKQVAKAIKALNVEWNFHDFRIVSGPTHVNLVFDLVIPFSEKRTKEEIKALLKEKIDSDKEVYLVLTIDHPMA
ncbi:cation diffusion facilitator family transporter [uncultured Faecalicoccus sp.]|uniref:cation diffusion facilitator family transporter n=1 Tax=uncultured Faecalicoccus sp. TaxID=1971760 RepID=UPI002603927B|nr:cation diffusion facilitator family transporter [uncultured Faecalicoccus sp.]